MSLPPALLNLLDQAKDALWAVSACMFHPSAKVKVNGRTCAYLPDFFRVSSPPRFSDAFFKIFCGAVGLGRAIVNYRSQFQSKS
jgi:hypothetical protein